MHNKKILVVKSEPWSWYKTGEEYEILSENKYEIGVQVKKEVNGIADVVSHGHYELI